MKYGPRTTMMLLGISAACTVSWAPSPSKLQRVGRRPSGVRSSEPACHIHMCSLSPSLGPIRSVWTEIRFYVRAVSTRRRPAACSTRRGTTCRDSGTKERLWLKLSSVWFIGPQDIDTHCGFGPRGCFFTNCPLSYVRRAKKGKKLDT